MYSYGRTKHKVFVSFYHADDQKYKDYIDFWLSYNIINKSVKNGEYDPDNKDEYIKRLIREDKISDSSVVVVLVGPHTKNRKHVDWEIYAGLSSSINGNAGLVGILLPELKRGYNNTFSYEDIPGRLADNVISNYAKIYDWEYAKYHFDSLIEEAFNDRIRKRGCINNSRKQMQYNVREW